MDLSMILSPDVEEEHPRDHMEVGTFFPRASSTSSWPQDAQPTAVMSVPTPSPWSPPSPPCSSAVGASSTTHWAAHDDHHQQQQHHHAPPTATATATDDKMAQRRRDYDLSRLDLLFQADAMIQERGDDQPSDRTPLEAAAAVAITNTSASQPPRLSTKTTANRSKKAANPPTASPDGYLRSGVWTRAEEEYAAALIFYFLRGALPITEGTTLRKYLAEQLCCNRRRVSMKLATESIADKKIPRKVGASVFVALKPMPTALELEDMVQALEQLRQDCFRDLMDPTDKHGQGRRSPLSSPSLSSSSPPRRRYGYHRETEESPSPMASSSGKRRGRHHATYSTGKTSRFASPVARKKKAMATASSSSSSLSLSSSRRLAGVKSPPQIKRRRPLIIRTGFDSDEEEVYTVAMVEYFLEGTLELEEGTRLVSYLCQQLQCSAKCLSMKLAPRRSGEQRFPDQIGSITFARSADDAFEAEAHVYELRQAWLQSREEGKEEEEEEEEEEVEEEEEQQHDASVKEEEEGEEDDSATESEGVAPSPVRRPSSALSDSSSRVKVEPRSMAPSQSKSSKNSHSRSHSSSSTPRSYSRSGPWSRHEEEYAAALIDCFFRGILDIVEGTTLRAFLTSRLGCNPMRISKKLASENIADVRIPKKLGSATYVQREGVSDEERAVAEEQLRHLGSIHQRFDIVAIKDEPSSVGAKHSRDESESVVDRRGAMTNRSYGASFKVRRLLVNDQEEYPPERASVNTAHALAMTMQYQRTSSV